MFSSFFPPLKIGWILGLIGLLAIPAAPLQAVIIRGTDSSTLSAPADDPGWSYLGKTANGLSCVYLGNGWVLTCAHCRVADGSETATFNGVTYDLVGTSIRLHETGNSNPIDLSLYQIETQPPGLNSLSISSATPANGSTVTGMGFGRDRVADPTHWNSSWEVDTTPPYAHTGYYWSGSRPKRWGQNQVADSGYTINAGWGNNYVIKTNFSESGGSGNLEFQASEGDSGGALFYKTSANVWTLSGILEAIGTYSGQPSGTAVFGNATYAVDLSYYRDQIVAAVQVFQFTGNLTNPNATIGTGWQNSQLLDNGGFGNLTGYCSVPVDFNGHQFTFQSGASNITYDGTLFGTGDLIVQGDDPNLYSITLSGTSANAYTGSTQVQSGLLVLDKTAGVAALSGSQITISTGAILRTDAAQQISASTALDLQGGVFNLNGQTQTIGTLSGTSGTIELESGVLTVNQTAAGTFSGQILGTGNFEKSGNADLILNGNNTYVGGTTINTGKLQVGNGGTTGTLGTGSVTNDAVLAFNRSDNITVSNTISGGGSLEQMGTGVLTLDAVNSYTGSTTVAAGTLKLGVTDAIPSGSNLTVDDGAAFDLAGYSQTLAGISGGGETIVSGGATLTSDTIYQGKLTIGAGSKVVLTPKSGGGPLGLQLSGLSPIPEPSTWVLLILAGMIGFARFLWKGKSLL